MFQLIFSHSASKIRHRNKCHSCLTWVSLFSYLIVQGDILCSCFLTPTDHVLAYQKLSFLIGDHNSDGTRRTPTCATAGGWGGQKFSQKLITKHNSRPKSSTCKLWPNFTFHSSTLSGPWVLTGNFWFGRPVVCILTTKNGLALSGKVVISNPT